METETVMKRKMNINDWVGIIPDNGIDSVIEVREIRKKLSEQCKDMSDEEFIHFLNSA
ncbi:MAG: hypothetical protein Q8R18_04455 [bacterium]|nr:hypothetical protein [bacterium]